MAATGSKKATGRNGASGSKRAANVVGPEAAPKSRVPLNGAFIVFAAAMLVRVIYFLNLRHCPLFQIPTIDAKTYYDLAAHFAHNEWSFPPGESYWQPPFYPFVLSIWMRVIGHSVIGLKLVQFAVASVNCALIYVLGTKIFDKKIGLIAGLAAAVYGPMIYFDGELLTPTVQTLFNLCTILLLMQATEKRSVPVFAAAGLLFGFSIITRPDVVGFLPAAVIWTVISLRKKASAAVIAGACAVLVIISLAPIVPLAHRNRTVAHENILISHNGGINFYIGNNSSAQKTQDIRPGPDWETLIEMPRIDNPEMTDADQDAWFYAQSFQWATSHPGAYIALQAKKLGQYLTAVEGRRNHDLYFYRNYSPLYSLLIFRLGAFAFPFGIVLPLALFGMIKMKWERGPWLLFLYMVTQIALTVAFFTCARYRITAVPAFLIFGAFGAVELWHSLRTRQWKPVTPYALVIAAFIFTNANIYNIDANRRWIDAETHFYMARNLADMGKPQKAADEYRKAMSLDPKYQDTYIYYAITLVDLKKNDEARNMALAGLRLRPTSTAANKKCGGVLMDVGDLWGALRCFQKADSIHPWSCPLLAELAKKATSRKDYLLVMRCYEAMYRQAPELPGLKERLDRIHQAYAYEMQMR